MSTLTQQTAAYYANLLILQYLQKVKAYATIQSVVSPVLLPDSNIQFITFPKAPVSGHFKLSYGASSTANIQWNDTHGTIQTALNAILTSPLTSTVSGDFASGFTITFSGYTSSVENLSFNSNTLVDLNSVSVIPVINPVGSQLPFEVQDGFNLSGNIAVGAQLDTIGKYVGVTRFGNGFFGSITLSDADFLLLIQMAIIRNRIAGGSLPAIQALLFQYFPNDIYLFDYQNMQMSYLIDTSVVGEQVLDLFITEGLLPRPMAVALSVIASPIINKFFAFRSYLGAAWVNTTPFQTYGAYDTSWLWLTYTDAVTV